MEQMELSEQELIRRNSLQELINLGIDPYPAGGYEVNATINEILKQFPENQNLFQEVNLAGRIMNRRIMGAASFAEIQDSTGRMQVYFKRDDVCPGEDKT
ncbi:MAG: OB-fold nucleic acid binding domain-containing protein, partial [Bacteroidales bacterium]